MSRRGRKLDAADKAQALYERSKHALRDAVKLAFPIGCTVRVRFGWREGETGKVLGYSTIYPDCLLTSCCFGNNSFTLFERINEIIEFPLEGKSRGGDLDIAAPATDPAASQLGDFVASLNNWADLLDCPRFDGENDADWRHRLMAKLQETRA